MRLLILSDVESKILWDYFDKRKLEGIDLIISCGDLDAEYLSFLATFFHGPILYVHGNHDDSYQENPPGGCICIEDQVYCFQGLRIAGLGGSMRYKPGRNQYTEAQMTLRAIRLWPRIYSRRERRLDVLVTHAPALGLGDGSSLAHTGFGIFRRILDLCRPRYMLHGHVHLSYAPTSQRILQYKDTTIINAYEKYVLEIPDAVPPAYHR